MLKLMDKKILTFLRPYLCSFYIIIVVNFQEKL